MSAAEDLYRQALALPEDERRELAAKLVASLPHEDDLDPAEVDEARRRLEEHRRDPSLALTVEQAKTRLEARRAAR